MIIWSGWGFLVAVIVFGASLTMELVTEALFHDKEFYQNQAWPLALALALSGVIVWTLGTYLHARHARSVIDKSSNPDHAMRHTFFFIPMRYWGPLLLALSLLPLVVR